MSNFTDTAASRETSVEIMEAIEAIAQNEQDAVRIWEDPTNAELVAIIERVTKNGLISSEDFCWGADGDQWAG